MTRLPLELVYGYSQGPCGHTIERFRATELELSWRTYSSLAPWTESGLIHWRLRQKHLQIRYHGHRFFLIFKPEGSWSCKCTPWYRIHLLKSNGTSMSRKGDTSSKGMSWRQRGDKLFGHDDILVTCEWEKGRHSPSPNVLLTVKHSKTRRKLERQLPTRVQRGGY